MLQIGISDISFLHTFIFVLTQKRSKKVNPDSNRELLLFALHLHKV